MKSVSDIPSRWVSTCSTVVKAIILMAALCLITGCHLSPHNATSSNHNGDWLEDAIFIIAASNSSSQDKQRANCVCKGVDDQIEIKAVIDDLPTDGGMIALLAGTYNISAPVVILRNSVIIRGFGDATEIYLADYSNCYMLIVGNNSYPISGVIIRDLKFNGNKANQSNDIWHGIVFNGYINRSEVSGCLMIYTHNSDIALLGPETTKKFNKG